MTDVVEELRKQTEQQEFSSKILAKQYLSKAPSFSFLGSVHRKEDVYLIKLYNSDAKIKSVYPFDHDGLLCKCNKIGQFVHVGEEIEIYFTTEGTKNFNKGNVFSFFFELEDGVKDIFFQNFFAKCLKDYKNSTLPAYIDCEVGFDVPRPDMTTKH